MADIPDFMREFDTDVDFGFTPVSKKPAEETTSQPSADPLELAKIKSDVSDIKSAMNEVMQIVAEKDSVNKDIQDADTTARFKELKRLCYLFYIIFQSLMNLIYIGQIEDQLSRLRWTNC